MQPTDIPKKEIKQIDRNQKEWNTIRKLTLQEKIKSTHQVYLFRILFIPLQAKGDNNRKSKTLCSDMPMSLNLNSADSQ